MSKRPIVEYNRSSVPYITSRHAKRNIWPHFTVFTDQERCCARSKSELSYKTSKSCDLIAKVANFRSDRSYIIKRITQTLDLFKTSDENNRDELEF